MANNLKLSSMRSKLDKIEPEKKLVSFSKFVKRHGEIKEGLNEIKVKVSCENGKSVSCEIDGLISAKNCIEKVKDICGKSSSATITWSN